MKPAKGKYGSAMAEKAAKKIQRQNARRASNAFLQAEVKESGLGLLQVAHFQAMSAVELKIALLEAERELSIIGMYPSSDGKDMKLKEQEKRIAYIYRVMKDLK